VKSGLSVRDASAERWKLELSLTDRDENERRDVLSSHSLDSECDAKRRQADEKPHCSDEGREMIR
jgi:hypothetical protein